MAINVKQTETIILSNPDFDEADHEIEELEEADKQSGLIEIQLQDEDCGERLDKVLSKRVPQYSRSRMQQWIEAGFVTIDGQTCKPKMTMLGDEFIIISPQAAPDEGAYSPENIPLNIVSKMLA